MFNEINYSRAAFQSIGEEEKNIWVWSYREGICAPQGNNARARHVYTVYAVCWQLFARIPRRRTRAMTNRTDIYRQTAHTHNHTENVGRRRTSLFDATSIGGDVCTMYWQLIIVCGGELWRCVCLLCHHIRDREKHGHFVTPPALWRRVSSQNGQFDLKCARASVSFQIGDGAISYSHLQSVANINSWSTQVCWWKRTAILAIQPFVRASHTHTHTHHCRLNAPSQTLHGVPITMDKDGKLSPRTAYRQAMGK